MELGADAVLIAEVAFAMLLGAVVGAEREWADKPAGLRTHMLVAGAAALLVGLADVLLEHFAGAGDIIRADPFRIVEAIITGISFIGAGTIFRRRSGDHVEGLTTAALLLFSAALGIAVGLGEYVLASCLAVLVPLTLRFMKGVGDRLDRGVARREDEK